MAGKPTREAELAVRAVLDGRATPAQAAAKYRLSPRHLRRLLKAAGAPDRRRGTHPDPS